MGVEGQIMSPDGNIHIGINNGNELAWSEDYSLGSVFARSIIIHESVHVFEARNGGCNVACMGLRKGSSALSGGYNYKIKAGKAFVRYNMEVRAQMYQDRFLLRNGSNAWNKYPVTLQQLNTLVTTPKL